MPDVNGASLSASSEALGDETEQSLNQVDVTAQQAQAAESAAEVLSRAAALSLRLNDFIEKLEHRSASAIAGLSCPDCAKVPNPSNIHEPQFDEAAEKADRTILNGPTAETTTPDAEYASHRMLPQVRECDWEHFVNRYSADEDLYCVEVLVANSEVDSEVDAEFEKRRSQADDDRSNAHELDTRPVRRIASDEKWIHRVRIQSKTLLKVFSKVTGYAWGNKPHTFVRPFQYLVYFHDRFKEELQRMEDDQEEQDRINNGRRASNVPAELRLDDITASAAPSGPSKDGRDDGLLPNQKSATETHVTAEGLSEAGTATCDAEAALNELRCYIQFAEEKLLPRSQMFRIENPSIRQKIRFSELWYLFKPGDLVYVPIKTLCANVEGKYRGYDWREAKLTTNYSSWRGQNIWRIESLSLPDAGRLPTAQMPDGESLEDRRLRMLYAPGSSPPESAKLTVYYLGYDGSSYSAISETFTIEYFDGEKDILELNIYPLRYHHHSKTLLEVAAHQGRSLTEAVKRKHWSYDGWTFVSDPIGALYNPSGSDRTARSPEHIQGQVIIDFKEAFNAAPYYKPESLESDQMRGRYSFGKTSSSSCAIQTWSDSGRTKLVRTVDDEIVLQDDCDLQEHDDYIGGDPYLTERTRPAEIRAGREDDLALIPPWIYIYALQQRRFAPVDVCRLRPIEIHNKAFEQLQLPKAHKDMIHAAVHSHLRRQRLERAIKVSKERELKSQDFIVGKGRGLLIMLHGAPGVGKTATAEAIAQQIAQPLFPVNCSDLSRYSGYSDTEDPLDEIFRLAHEWDCVLLMDEADVFLSARSTNNWYGDNSIVSIFLRKLEYYNGMLFLTTNRIGKLDSAVASRLHLILHYKRLGRAEIMNIFRTNIQLLKEAEEQQAKVSGQPELCIVEDDILQYAEAHCAKHPKMRGAWNGRQIRNAFVVASSLARYEASKPGRLEAGVQPQLQAKHFEQVEEVNAKFWRLRKALSNMDEAARALLYEERDDYFEEEEIMADKISNQRPTSSRSNISSLLQANLSQNGVSMQKQSSYGQGTSSPQPGAAHLGQTSVANYVQQQQQQQQQHQQQSQQPGVGQWMMANSLAPQNQMSEPRFAFPSQAPFHPTALQDPLGGRGLQKPDEVGRTYSNAGGGTGYAYEAQQQTAMGVSYGSMSAHSSGMRLPLSQTGTMEDIQRHG